MQKTPKTKQKQKRERISVKAAGNPRAAQVSGDGLEAEQPRQAAITHLTDGTLLPVQALNVHYYY